MKTLLIILCLAAAGCAGTLPEPVNGWSAMQPTVTTKQDIVARYGEPTEVWGEVFGTDRNQVYVYDLGKTRECRLVFVGDLLSQKVLFYRGEPAMYFPE
ncbi:MAG: hypothetical protein WC749_01900 [Dehalococcoidia bacterium]